MNGVRRVAVPAGSSATADDAGFDAFVSRFEATLTRFINGDPTPLRQLLTRRDDATLLGGWGAYAKGFAAVAARGDWAAARFRDSGAQLEVEYLARAVSGDLAYTVTIERSTVLVAGQAQGAPMALRVTHVFRKEDGAWTLLHRHADPLLEKTAPDTVLDQ